MNNLFFAFDLQLIMTPKIFLIPIILGIIVLLEKKFGTVLSGAFSGLPLVSGTLMSFSIFYQKPEDYKLSLYGAIEGVVSLSIMMFAYSKMTYAATNGYGMQINASKRHLILIKSLLIYIITSFLFLKFQIELNDIFNSDIRILFIFIASCIIFNFLLYKKLPKILPDENKINLKFKNWFYMTLISTITFSLFSSIKTYGTNASIIGLISTAPIYLSVIILMTHRLSTDYNLIHFIRGMLVGFFGYLLFFTIFLLGLIVLNLPPILVISTAIITIIGSYISYGVIFSRKNKSDITKMSLLNVPQVLPLEEYNFKHYLEDIKKEKK